MINSNCQAANCFTLSKLLLKVITLHIPSSAKGMATQIVVISKLNGRKYFILRGFICDIIRSSKELPVQS